MPLIHRLSSLWRNLFRKPQTEQDLKAEVDAYLEMLIEMKIEQGIDSAEARRQALIEMGGVEQVKERVREARMGHLLETLWQDLRYGVRMLIKQPGFTLFAFLTLALGIGANTTIFSVINALLFRPLPYAEASRLIAVTLYDDKPGPDLAKGIHLWSYPSLTALREQQSSFDAVAAYSQIQMTVNYADQAEKSEVEIVTADYFSLLGLNAELGRVFAPEEDRTPNTHPVALLSHKIWQQRFGGDPKVIGRTISIKNFPFTVIGVMPAGVGGQKGTTDLWAPMMMSQTLTHPGRLTASNVWWLNVISRLKSRINLAQAQAEANFLSNQIDKLVSDQRRGFISLKPLKETKIDPRIQRSFLILLVVVGFVLLIACANLANLSLARAVSRRKEFAVRLALGASKWRIFRQVLTESLLLATFGGLAGLVLALWGIDWLGTVRPWNTIGFWSLYAQTFDYFRIELDWQVLAFCLLVTTGAGIAFGIFPALQAIRQNVNASLKEGAGGSIAGFHSLRRPSTRNTLVVTQIALSLMLLAGAGLAINSLWKLLSVKLGFEPNEVVTMSLGTDKQGLDFYRELLERTQRIPGVESASFASVTPLSGGGIHTPIEIEGRTLAETSPYCKFNIVTPDYFKTLRIALLQGRVFGEQDRAGAPRVAVISRATAEEFWPGENPLVKRIKSPFNTKYETNEQWVEVIGIVDDLKYGSIDDEVGPVIYLPQWQPTIFGDKLTVRVAGDPAAAIGTIRSQVSALDKTVPIYNVKTMRENIARVTSRYRYSAWLMGSFAALALLLTAMGLYGVMGYTVSARTQEIGIRIALGAQTSNIAHLIIIDGIRLIGLGTILGLLAAFLSTRVLKNQLYGVETTDWLTFLLVFLVLVVVALFACYLPTRRATKVDPMVALRYE